MWFKKKAYIIGYNSNTAADGIDWRPASRGQSWPASSTLPSAADANNYFYLPALGYYDSGRLYSVGNIGYYWLSSANGWYSSEAYYLAIYSGHVDVGSSGRYSGYRAEAFQ